MVSCGGGGLQAKKFDTAETMAFKERNTELLVRLKQVGNQPASQPAGTRSVLNNSGLGQRCWC